jgi:Secretion system C-terminal sorting domain
VQCFYDINTRHIYRVSKDNKGFYLSVSDSAGIKNSWQIRYRSGLQMYLTVDYAKTGTIYLTDSDSIFESTNYGNSFFLYKVLDSKIVGIYVKPGADFLYASTENNIYKVTPTSLSVVKNYDSIREGQPKFMDFKLNQNYPNPFNPTTEIAYTISRSSFVTIKVYDFLGREVTTLVNLEKPVGSYEVEFNGSNLASGIYFYRIQAGNYSTVKKMILLK